MKSGILSILLVFISFVASAQVDRRMTPQHNPPPKKQPSLAEQIDASVLKMAKELTLDAFQQAVIKDQLKSSQAEIDKIAALDIPTESKNEKYIAVQQKLVEQIKSVLNPEQVAKYEAMGKKKQKKKSD